MYSCSSTHLGTKNWFTNIKVSVLLYWNLTLTDILKINILTYFPSSSLSWTENSFKQNQRTAFLVSSWVHSKTCQKGKVCIQNNDNYTHEVLLHARIEQPKGNNQILAYSQGNFTNGQIIILAIGGRGFGQMGSVSWHALPELHCDPMPRSTRITEANTTVASLRICLLGWLHRSCTVGIQCHDVIAFNYLRFKHRLSSLEVLCELVFCNFPSLWNFSDFPLLLNLFFAP